MSRREIYRPSQEARDRRNDLEQEWYERVSNEIECEMRREHELEFGLSPRFPFTPCGPRIHAAVVKRLAAIKAGND